MNIEEAIEHAEGALNHAWSLDISIHGGDISVELYDADGELFWAPPANGNLVNQILQACKLSHGL